MGISNAPLQPYDADEGCGDEEKTILTSANAPAFDNPMTAGALLDLAAPESTPIISGVNALRRNTIFLAGCGVDANMIACVFAQRSTTTTPLPPFSTVNGVPTYAAFANANWGLVRECLGLLYDQDGKTSFRNQSRSKLAVTNRTDKTGNVIFLNQASGKERFIACISECCKLVVLVDPDAWHSNDEDSVPSTISYPALLAELNVRGIATLSIFRTTKRGPTALFTQLADDGNNFLLEFRDVGKARQFGASLQVTRRRMSAFDNLPRHFLWSYSIIDGELAFWWECLDPNDGASIKKQEQTERELIVKTDLESGLNQKQIALKRSMSESTVSRCISNMKREKKGAGELYNRGTTP